MQEPSTTSYVQKLREKIGHDPILTAGVLLLAFNENNEVLMQLRSDYNQWGFPGGTMELGESFEETAKRELKEETNLNIEDLKLIKVVSGKDTYREYPNGDKLYDITAIFVVKKYSDNLAISDIESKRLQYFNVDNLPSNLAPHTRNYLKKFGDILHLALSENQNK